MTVNSSTTKVSYSGDGNATVFAYTFKIFADADLTVIVRTDATGAESTKTLTTDYTVSGAGNAGGGNVTMVTAPSTGETLVIKRSLELTQSTDYVANDPFPAAAHEDALDKLTFIAQQQQEVFDRAVVFPETDTADTTIPDSVTRANKFLGFGASGEVAVLSSTGTAPGAIDTGNLVDGAVTTAKLASTAVTTAKITDDAVTQAKIADDAVGQAQIADDAVGSDQIADDAVTVAKININGGELVLDADGDTSITADTDDQIDFKTGGTDRLVIDSSGNVGIGETSPDELLHLTTSGNTRQRLETTSSGSVAVTQFENAANEIHQIGAETSSGNGGFGGSTAYSFCMYAASGRAICLGTNGANRMTIDTAGIVGIGTGGGSITSNVGHALYPGGAHYMHQAGTESNTTLRFYRNGSIVGTISTTGTGTAYNTSSDHRLKENVADMTGAITRVKALAPKRFNFIADSDTTVDGFLAHEAQTVVPEAVTGTHNEVDADGNAVMQGIDQAKLVPLLTGALQEAIAKIETLEARLTALEGA